MMRICLFCSSLAVACGDNASNLQCPTGSNVIKVGVVGELDVAVYRDGSQWRDVTRTTDGYAFCADSSYEFASVCVSPSGYVTLGQFAFLSHEMRDIFLSDCGGLRDSDARVISGTMVQRGRVSLGGVSAQGVSPGWSFSFYGPPGTYDLLASDAFDDVVDSEQRVVVRREIEVSEDIVLQPAVDLDSAGIPLQVVEVDATNLENDERLETLVELKTIGGDELQVSSYREPRFRVIPADMLFSTDQQLVTVRAVAPGFVRSIRVPVSHDSPLEFLPRLTDVEFGVRRATWQKPLVQGSVVTASFRTIDQRMFTRASAAWLETHGKDEVGISDDAPWFNSGWAFMPSSSDFSVAVERGEARYVTTVSSNP